MRKMMGQTAVSAIKPHYNEGPDNEVELYLVKLKKYHTSIGLYLSSDTESINF